MKTIIGDSQLIDPRVMILIWGCKVLQVAISLNRRLKLDVNLTTLVNSKSTHPQFEKIIYSESPTSVAPKVGPDIQEASIK